PSLRSRWISCQVAAKPARRCKCTTRRRSHGAFESGVYRSHKFVGMAVGPSLGRGSAAFSAPWRIITPHRHVQRGGAVRHRGADCLVGIHVLGIVHSTLADRPEVTELPVHDPVFDLLLGRPSLLVSGPFGAGAVRLEADHAGPGHYGQLVSAVQI